MDGNGEGMVAVVHGLRDAGLAVTLTSKRCASQGRKVAKILAMKNQCLPQTKSSVETNTYSSYDGLKINAGVQICDDRYASSYQLAHCRMNPTSPPVSLAEFPPQRSQPNRTQGNFEIGGNIGSGELTSGLMRTQYSFRNSLRWAGRSAAQFSRASCQTDPFVHSLRRYPCLPPSRSISADLIERLIKHTQAKNLIKPSKISKSMRSIPKDKSEEQTNRRERKSKNIQTYTRTRNEDRSNDNDGVRKERSYRLSFSGDRRHRKNKDSPINTTYDYLKGNSSLYRKRHDRVTDVRYLDNLAKYIKDTLQQVCDDRPVLCPKIQSRYNQHRKNYHHEQSSHESNDADDQAAPSASRESPSTSFESKASTCIKDCPKGRKICELCRKPLACPCVKSQSEAGTSSPSLPTASKFCQCLPDDVIPGKGKSSRDEAICLCKPNSDNTQGYDKKWRDPKESQGYDQRVNDEVLAWIKRLPVKAGDTPENVAARERIGRELAEVLKNIPQDDYYNDNVMNEVKKYMDKLPIWLPDNKPAQDAFKDLMARNLLDKLNEIPDKPDKFADIIKKWVNGIDFKKDVDEDKIVGDFIDKLRPIALNRPKNNYDYAKKLKEAINDMLEDLPIDTKGDKQRTINQLADKLIEKLVSLPEVPKKNIFDKVKEITDKADKFADTIKKWVNDIDFKKDVDKNKIIGDFIDKLRPIALNRPENDYDYANKLKEAINNMLEDLPINTKGDKPKTINQLADKLTEKLVNLPELPKKANNFADTIKQWVNNIKFNRDMDKNKVADDFTNKLKPIALNRPDSNYEYAQKLREAIKDKLQDLPVYIKGDKEKELNELADNLTGNLVSLPKDTIMPKDMVKPLNEYVDIINDWLNEDYPFLKDSKAVDDLAKKLRELQAKGVDANVVDQMRNVIQDFLKNVLDIKDPETLERLTNKLLKQFLGDNIPTTTMVTSPKNREEEVEKIYQDVYKWMKNRPELSHLDPEKIKELCRELANQIYDNKIAGGEEINMSDWLKRKLSDIGAGQTAQDKHKRNLVLNEIDNFLADAVTDDLPSDMKQELKDELADMLIKNVDEIIHYEVEDDLLEDETDRMIDKLFEGVKDIYTPGHPALKVKIPKETNKTLHEELDGILDYTTGDIKDKDALKTNLINTLVDGIRKGENENDLIKEIYDELRAANLSEEEAKKVAQNLLDKAKDMTLALKCQDSNMAHKKRLSKAEPSKFRNSINYQLEDNIFVPDDVLILDKRRKSSFMSGVDAENKLTIPADVNGLRRKSMKDDEPLSEELLEQLKIYNIDPNDKAAVARFKDALQQSKQGKGPLDKVLASLRRYSNLPKVPRKEKSKVAPSSDYLPSPAQSYSGVKKELIVPSSVYGDDDARSQIKTEPEENMRQLSEARRKKLDRIDDTDIDKNKQSKIKGSGSAAGSAESFVKDRPGSLGDRLDSKTRQEIKQSLKGGIQDVLDDANIKIDDREDLESKLNSLLNQLAVGNVDDVTDDIYKLLRNANIPDKQARDITKKLLDRTKNISEAAAQKIKAGLSKSRSLDSKTQQDITQALKGHIDDVLNDVNAEIDNRIELETKLNTLLNRHVVGERDDVKDDVHKLLRKANIPGDEAKTATNKLIGKAQDLAESLAQKIQASPSKSRPLDSKTKQEIKQTMKADIQKALDKVKTKIDDREHLESNLLNTMLNQVEQGDVENVRDDVLKMLREAKIPGEEANTVTNKLIGKAKDLADVVAQRTQAGPSRGRQMDSKTKQEIKQSLKGDIEKSLDKVKSKINDRQALESKLLNSILDQIQRGDVEDIRDDVYRLLRNANISGEEARNISSKLLGTAKKISEALPQKTQDGPSRRKRLDSKTKEEIKQTLKGDIEKVLDKVKSKIDDRENLESDLFNAILDRVEEGDVEEVRDGVFKLLREAQLPGEEAKTVTNKLISKAKDLAEVVAQKTKTGPSKRPFDYLTKQEIKQTLKGDIQKALDKVKTKIDDRENLESDLLNAILDEVEQGDVENVRDDVLKLLREAQLPREEAKTVTNKLISKAKDLAEVVAQKTQAEPSRRPLDSETKQEIKQTLKCDIQKTLDKVKTKIDDRENLESNLLNTMLDQVEQGDVENVRDDVLQLLREVKLPGEEAKTITNKLIGKAKDLADVVAQRTQAEPSRGRQMDSKTKQEIKQSLKGDIQKELDKVKSKIDDRQDLESKLLNTILDQIQKGDVEDIRDDVYRLLRNANIPVEEARNITNKLLGTAEKLSESLPRKTQDGPSRGRQLDSKTKHEIKQSLKGDIQKALDKVKTKIDDRENLESNLLNTILDQVEGGDVEDVRDDVYRLLRNANISGEESRNVTNKLIGKGKDLSEVVDQMRSRIDDEDSFEDTPKSGKAYAQKRRPDDLKGRMSSKQRDELRESIIGDVSNVVDGAPLPLSSHTKNVLKAKLSSALIKALEPQYSKEEAKSKVLEILSEESIRLQGDGRSKTASGKVGQKDRRRDVTGRAKIIHENILKEITNALDDAPTKIPKSKRNNLRNKLADIILANIKSDLIDVRMKIFDLLTRETHLHKGVISDLSIDIIERIIDVIKNYEIANRRKTKKIVYSLQVESKKRARKNDDNVSSDEDKSMSRSKSTVKHDSSNLSKSISDHIDYTIAKEGINIPQYKISEIKQNLENLSPKDILAMIRGDKAIKNKILDVLIKEIKIKGNDAKELINGVIKRFNETDDSQYSATSSQMQDMKGYLKGEILGLLEKYNVKFNREEGLKSGATSPTPSARGEAPISSTPRDSIVTPIMINEPSLSIVHGDDVLSESTLKTSDRINSLEYLDNVLDVVNTWVDELPVDLNDISYRENMVKELAADIIERQKYLQLNPEAKTSAKEELECLKYQVFRWLNNVFDVGDLTPMMPKIAELRDRVNDIRIPLFDKSSKRHRGNDVLRNKNTSRNNIETPSNVTLVEYKGKERASDVFVDKFEDWVESLPTKFKNEEERQQYENMKSELLSRLKELGPNASPQAIQHEINKFLRKAPLDPSKKIDLDDKIDELTRIVQTTEPSKMEAASFESKTGYKKLPNLLYDFIEKWCDSLPFDDNLDQDTIRNIKHSLANKILQKICQLNLNPEILNDDFLYEDVLRDELDNLLNDIRHYLPIDDDQLAEFKDLLVNKIKEAKQKTQNELAGQMYKQQLRDAVSRTLPIGLELTSEDQTSLEVLKDAVADAFINLNYASINEELRNKLRRKITDEVTRFCNNYLQRHPSSPLCSNKLNQDLYAALTNVSLPNDESMRSEVEHVRLKEVITDWVKGLPLAEQTLTGQSTLNKMISILAKRLHDLEHAAELNDADYTEEMKKEIKKWLRKLPLLGGKDAIDHYAADLIDRLKNTEDSRKFDASTRLQLDGTEICPGPCHYAIKEKPKPPKPCPDTCKFTPQFPTSLTREDREHLDRIRERVQQARSKLAKRPCRDASPSPCMNTGSQTDIRSFGPMKSIPSVCPGPFQKPYKSAASRLRETPSCHVAGGTPRAEKSPCPGMSPRQGWRRKDGASPCVEPFSPCAGSYNDVQPQIIVKEYYWDSTGNSFHQIPCRTPCDNFQGSQEPRSPCSRPSPTCRAQYSQPHTAPQTPLISSSDQENRRPRPEPCSSRYYKEKVTRLGSLDDMKGHNLNDKQSENFDWNSARFPEDDDFWGPCQRPIILSDDDFGPFSRERERKEEKVRCRCRERVLTKCSTKRRNRFCNSCNNDPTKRCAKCSPAQCPHPSYLYFRK